MPTTAGGEDQRRRAGIAQGQKIFELVGQTPMLHLRRIAGPSVAFVYAKPEFLSPGGNIKDRAALGMILQAEWLGIVPALNWLRINLKIELYTIWVCDFGRAIANQDRTLF